jgi:Methyltransferase FkbM domain
VASCSTLLVEGLRIACAAERVADDALAKMGIRRRYFSQKGQDRWVVERALRGRKNGYFVEVGAGDGRTHSNTYALERDHGWTGVLVEANPAYRAAIARTRRCAHVEACVDGHVGEAAFLALGYLGGLIAEDTDNAPTRRGSLLKRHADKIMRLPVRPLGDILAGANAPALIDYLSIDVEGAEFRILEPFPFHRFAFAALTVERPTRQVHDILTGAGYVLDRMRLYDGYYVSRNVADDLVLKERPFSGARRKSF